LTTHSSPANTSPALRRSVTLPASLEIFGVFSGIAWADRSWNTLQFTQLSDKPGTHGRILSIESDAWGNVFYYVDKVGLYKLSHADSIPIEINIDNVKKTDRITCIEQVGQGIVIGAEGRKVYLYQTDNGSWYEIPFSRPGSAKTLIWDVLVNEEGHMWVATSDDGVWHASDIGDTLDLMDEFPGKGAYTFSKSDDGFWCGTPFGLYKYHTEHDYWIHFYHPSEKNPTDFQVFTLCRNQNELWYGAVGFGAGYLRIKDLQWKDMRAGLSNPNVAAIAVDDSVFWTSYAYQQGYVDRFFVHDLHYDRNVNYVDSLLDPQIQEMILYRGILFYGGYTGFGYVDYDNHDFFYYGKESLMPYGDIADIEADDDTLYLAASRGIMKYTINKRDFVSLTSTEGERVSCLKKIDNELWYGTLARGFKCYDLQTHTVSDTYLEQAIRIMSIQRFNDDNLLIATRQSGIHLLNRKNKSLNEIRIPEKELFSSKTTMYDREVTSMQVINNLVFVGLYGEGIIVGDMTTGTWVRLSYCDGLISDEIKCIESSSQYIWIGCFGGLNRYEKKYMFELIEQKMKEK